MKRRITFFSKHDGSAGYNLSKSIPLIENFNPEKSHDINDIIELYHIKQFFDNDIYLKDWTEETKKKYHQIVNQFWPLIINFWGKIDSENIPIIYNEIEYQYYDAFWDITDTLKTYKKITNHNFTQILNSEHFHSRHVLQHENIVRYFTDEIRTHLLNKDDTAEILLSSFEEDHYYSPKALFFPPTLTISDKELITNKYLESESPNLNYVRLIITAKHINFQDKLKLKAKKLAEKLTDTLFEKDNSFMVRICMSISKDQEAIFEKNYDAEEKTLIYSYSEKYLNSTLNPFGILKNFADLFNYMTYQGCINLLSKDSEISSLEKTLMRSKNEYYNDLKFYEKSKLSNLQLASYLYYLTEHNISIESVLSDIVNNTLSEIENLKGLVINFPSIDRSPLEKIRTLAPELEFLLKQYKSYTDEGHIDKELLQFSSLPFSISQIKSAIPKKYAYGIGNEYLRLKFCFFSDQSLLHYIEPYKNKYANLFQLLYHEKVKYNNFESYQRDEIDHLISKNYLFVDNESVVRINNESLIQIISILHHEGVISYLHFPEHIRQEVLILEEKGMVRFTNTLFTEDERKYLNYYLNKKDFTNGLDLRNKYLHGTNTNSIEIQQNDYYILLKITILIILKIKDDLYLEIIEKKNWC